MSVYKGIYFRGRGIIIPGAYADVDATSMVPNRLSPANVLAMLGQAKGGVPNQAVRVLNLRDAVNMLRSGDLKTAAELAYDPSADMPGAGEVIFIRVAGTGCARSTSDLSSQVTLTAVDYGEHTNFLRRKIEAGSVAGRKITINHQADDITEVYDNIGPVFQIQYVGSASAARMSFDASTKILLIEINTGSWVPLVTYTVTNIAVDTISELVTILDSHQDLTCNIHKYGSGNMSSSLLDAMTQVDIKTALTTVSSEVGSLITWVNNRSALCTAAAGVSATGNFTNSNWTNFVNGSEGSAPDVAAWSAALALLESETDVKYIYCATDNESIHTAAIAHCTTQSDPKVGRERRLIFGGAASETVDQATTRAINQGSPRAMLVYPGIKRVNAQTNLLTVIPPYLTAAAVAGMAAGATPETPLTYKTIKAHGMEKYLKDAEVEQLLQQGVTPIRYVKEDAIYQIVQSITTWQKDANVIYRKWSGMGIHDYLRQEARNTAKPFIGRVGDMYAMLSIKNAVAAKLDLLTRTPQNPNGVLTKVWDYAKEQVLPAWDNLLVEWDGYDHVNVSFRAHPVGEIAYITIMCTLEPAKMTV